MTDYILQDPDVKNLHHQIETEPGPENRKKLMQRLETMLVNKSYKSGREIGYHDGFNEGSTLLYN